MADKNTLDTGVRNLLSGLFRMQQSATNQDIQQVGLREKNLLYIFTDLFRKLISYTNATPRLYVVADLNAAQTLATVTTVSTLTGITNWGTLTANQFTMYQSRLNVDNGPRARVNSF